MTSQAPIALFAYSRLDHLRRTVESLQQNSPAADSDLIVYSDGPRTPETEPAVQQVREYLATISGFRSVTIRSRDTNLGLAESIIRGVSEVLGDFDRIIVVEDDLVTSPHFLTYMNDGLDRYADNDRVVSIHGYVYPVGNSLPEAFFLPGADCWGWATWRRGWECFNPDGSYLLAELKRRNMLEAFDFDGAFPYTRMLEDQISGKNDSWAIRWYASALLAGKLTLYPGRNLVHNIGNDGTGTHPGITDSFDTPLSSTPIDLGGIPVTPSQAGFDAVARYFRRSRRRQLVRRASAGLGPSIKAVARDWLPPAVRSSAEKIGWGASKRLRFEGDYASWDAARAASTGYDAPEILAKVLQATLAVHRGEASFERDSVVFDEIQHSWLATAGLMWAAARGDGRLNVLDFGGALGSSYTQNQALLHTLPDVRWNVVEQAHYVDAAHANHLADDRLHFYQTIEQCLRDNRPNVILLSAVLHYLESPADLIDSLSDVNAEVLIVDRTPFSALPEDKLLIQHVPPSIYAASYPMWVFSRPSFERRLAPTWRLMASDLSLDGSHRSNRGLEFAFQGMLFETLP